MPAEFPQEPQGVCIEWEDQRIPVELVYEGYDSIVCNYVWQAVVTYSAELHRAILDGEAVLSVSMLPAITAIIVVFEIGGESA